MTSHADVLARLTKREAQVFALMRRGFTNSEIGRHLETSASTVKNHVASIIRKLEVSNRTEAVGLEPAVAPPCAPPTSDPPAIAVLRFACSSADGLLQRFADAIVDELTTRLSRCWYPVIARCSAFHAQATAVDDVVAVGRKLSARYVVEGSLAELGARARLHVRLLDAANAHVLWAEAVDAPSAGLFELLDELSQRVFESVYRSAVTYLATALDTGSDLASWQLSAQGMWHFWQREVTANGRARELFTAALAKDARNRLGLYGLALTHQRDLSELWSPAPAQSASALADASRRFLALWPDDAWANLMASYAAVYRGERELALALVQSAIAREPSLLGGRSLYGQLLAMDGQSGPAVAELERTLRLSPCTPERWVYECVMALAYFAGGEYGESSAWAQRSAASSSGTGAMAYGVLASSLAHLGEVEPAREAAQTFRTMQPMFSNAHFSTMLASTRPEIAARYLDGLQRACSW